MNLIVNLSMLGDRPTGLGVYALGCAKIANTLKSTIIGKVPSGVVADAVIPSPMEIGIGGGIKAAIRRQFWYRRLVLSGRNLVYSPTHHGLSGESGQIITIHDLICLRFPRQHYTQYLYFKYFMPFLLRKCLAVFTVSEASKKDIVSTYGYAADNVYVVPNSIDSNFFRPAVDEVESTYLLMVGARYSHKNVVEVLRNSHLWGSRYRLVVTSCSGPYREVLERLIREKNIGHLVEFRDYVSRDELLKLYQGCAALIYPSKWEGFGIPPLEALACGRPVIVSDTEVHREVLGDSGIYVTLGSESDWKNAFLVLDDAEKVAEYVKIGHQRVLNYSAANMLSALERSLLDVAPNLERL